MKREDFLPLVEAEFNKIKDLFGLKNQSYGASDDLFFNFRQTANRIIVPLAESLGAEMSEEDAMFLVAEILVDKHDVALAKGINVNEAADRLRDRLVYTLLELAMIEAKENAEAIPENGALFLKTVDHQAIHTALSDANSNLVQKIKKFAESFKSEGTRVVVKNKPATEEFKPAPVFDKEKEKLPGLTWKDLERVKVREDGTLYLEPATGGPIDGSIMVNLDHFDVVPDYFTKMKREAAARGEIILSKFEAAEFQKLAEKNPGMHPWELVRLFASSRSKNGGGEDAKD